MDTITLHHYYFAASGRLMGLIPGTCKVEIISGPFLSFENRVLRTPSYRILLPEGMEETSRNPPLRQNTIDILKRLNKHRT